MNDSSLLVPIGVFISASSALITTFLGAATLRPGGKWPSRWGWLFISLTIFGSALSLWQARADELKAKQLDGERMKNEALLQVLNRIPRQVAILRFKFRVDNFGVKDLPLIDQRCQLLLTNGKHSDGDSTLPALSSGDVIQYVVFLEAVNPKHNNLSTQFELENPDYDFGMTVDVCGRTTYITRNEQTVPVVGSLEDYNSSPFRICLYKLRQTGKQTDYQKKVCEVFAFVTSADPRWNADPKQ